MPGRLSGRIAVVTGAGSGIGERIAHTFAREGAYVVAADKNTAAVTAVVSAIETNGGRAEVAAVDVANAEASRAMIDGTVTRHGQIDILVNNAGYGIKGTVLETSEDDWDAIMAVNVKGVFLASKFAIPHMEKAGGGSIINTASTTSKVGIRDRAAYVTTKGAVAALTRAMALDHVDAGIRVNCVAPGTIESPFFDDMFARSDDPAGMRRGLEARQAMNRLGTPQEVANAILFLASDEASFCTGSMLVVDGGWTAK